MPKMYLLRHCDYDNPRTILPGRLPVELSEQGKRRAQELQQFFADKEIAAIYSSAVLRCRQTVEIIADKKIPIFYDTRLLETLSAYQGYWGENQTAAGFEFFLHQSELGGETLQDIHKRVASFWEEITKNLSQNILVCSHGDPLMVLHHHIHKIPLPDDNVTETNLAGWLEKGAFNQIELP
jgi:broad specificity phosphatase PhoE